MGDGAYGLYKATITSKQMVGRTNKLDLRGYRAGYGATYHCLSGHTCNIYCYASGCYMLYLQCDGTCNIIKQSAITPEPVTNINNIQLDALLYDSVAIELE